MVFESTHTQFNIVSLQGSWGSQNMAINLKNVTGRNQKKPKKAVESETHKTRK